MPSLSIPPGVQATPLAVCPGCICYPPVSHLVAHQLILLSQCLRLQACVIHFRHLTLSIVIPHHPKEGEYGSNRHFQRESRKSWHIHLILITRHCYNFFLFLFFFCTKLIVEVVFWVCMDRKNDAMSGLGHPRGCEPKN